MAKASSYTERNPAVKLLAHVIPGSKWFPHVLWRICGLLAGFTVIGGVYYLVGGEVRDLWNPNVLFTSLALTFLIGTLRLGFKPTLTGFMSALFGPPDKTEKTYEEFNLHVREWAMMGAHLFAFLNLFRHFAIAQMLDLSVMGTVLYPISLGYVYALVLGLMLPSRAMKEKSTGKIVFSDALLPVILLTLCIWGVRFLAQV